MRSRYADYFNHDDEAEEYDVDVTREEDPVRSGYASLLSWVGSRVAPTARVLDLGSGTGNTIEALPHTCIVTAVDVSAKMSEISMLKLGDRSVTYVLGDILEYVTEAPLLQFDSIVSTYALHHLTPEERELLFTAIRHRSSTRLQVLVGDLMYRNETDRDRIVEELAESFPELPSSMEEEFYRNIDRTTEMLNRLGWKPSWRKFSRLSWAVELL